MPNLSIIIPAKNELFLFQTVEDIYQKAQGDIEVIVVLDGYWPTQMPLDHKNLTLLHHGYGMGMRTSINDAASIARGKFLLKCDGHCMFAEGFDETVTKECEDNWVVVPRRHSLDAERWEIKPERPAIDYHFLSYPYEKPQEIGMHGQPWAERAKARKNELLDDEMSSQGSCWIMQKKHFDGVLKGLSTEGYGTFVQEFQEIGLKTWLSGGRVVVNKKTWYAHLHKGKQYGRGYFIDKREMVRGAKYSADFWMHNKWPDQKYKMEWFIEKFWPVPSWPSDFLENPDKYRNPPSSK
jgi:glycosyltransferase involved in cell wall biosynthesis